MSQKNPDDLRNVRAKCLHNSDFAPFLHRHRDQRAHDTEGGDDDDEEEEKEHHITLEPDCLENLVVHIDPGPRGLGDFEEFFDLRFHFIDIIRVFGFNRDSMKGVA